MDKLRSFSGILAVVACVGVGGLGVKDTCAQSLNQNLSLRLQPKSCDAEKKNYSDPQMISVDTVIFPYIYNGVSIEIYITLLSQNTYSLVVYKNCSKIDSKDVLKDNIGTTVGDILDKAIGTNRPNASMKLNKALELLKDDGIDIYLGKERVKLVNHNNGNFDLISYRKGELASFNSAFLLEIFLKIDSLGYGTLADYDKRQLNDYFISQQKKGIQSLYLDLNLPDYSPYIQYIQDDVKIILSSGDLLNFIKKYHNGYVCQEQKKLFPKLISSMLIAQIRSKKIDTGYDDTEKGLLEFALRNAPLMDGCVGP